jgi:hypothetical protein
MTTFVEGARARSRSGHFWRRVQRKVFKTAVEPVQAIEAVSRIENGVLGFHGAKKFGIFPVNSVSSRKYRPK